jgi:endo-alpha-1,4-polygalactosaminidase (GH114 family)
MKTQISSSLFTLFLPLLILTSITLQQVGSTSSGLAPGHSNPLSQLTFLRPGESFIVYYNTWPADNDKFYETMGRRYRLIILNTDDVTPPDNIKNDLKKSIAYKKRRIKMLQDQGAMVFAYLSVGEEYVGDNNNKPYEGNKQGPCSSVSTCSKKGVASYYIDDGTGHPAKHLDFNSFYVNAGDLVWRKKMKEKAKGILSLGCNGLFLDTLDTVVNYEWTQEGMIRLLQDINSHTSNIIVNRGIVLLDTKFAGDYRKYSWAIMYEDLFTDWDGNQGVLLSDAALKYNIEHWVPSLMGENVLVVDFANCEQLAKKDNVVTRQIGGITEINAKVNPQWANYIADYDFKEIRYNFKCEK